MNDEIRASLREASRMVAIAPAPPAPPPAHPVTAPIVRPFPVGPAPTWEPSPTRPDGEGDAPGLYRRAVRRLWDVFLVAGLMVGPLIAAVVNLLPGPHPALEDFAQVFLSVAFGVLAFWALFGFVDAAVATRGHVSDCTCEECEYLRD